MNVTGSSHNVSRASPKPNPSSSVLTADERTRANDAMDRYADGDASAFSTLYDLLAPRLYGYARRQTRDASKAEDLVQHTLLRMHCARDSYIRGANVIPWAFAILRRLIIDGYRSGSRCETRANIDVIETAFCPEETVSTEEMVRSLRAVIEALPASQREAFELVRADGLPCAVAAEILGTTENAIKVRVHRAVQAMRDALRAHEMVLA